MVFDKEISETVSLSKVLDVFIEYGEKPETILTFLESHKESMTDIIDYSEMSDRIFCLDFLGRCSLTHMSRLLTILDKCGYDHRGMYLAWQVLQSDATPTVKDMFLRYKDSKKKLYIRHPYGGYGNGIIQDYDKLFCNFKEPMETIAERINMISSEKFENIIGYFRRSLFRYRIYQRDLFSLLDPLKQYMILKDLKREKRCGWLQKFITQILNSDMHVEIKREVYDILENMRSECLGYNGFSFKMPDELVRIIEESDSYARMQMTIDIYGIDVFGPEMIFYLLVLGKKKILKGMVDSNREFVESNFRISDLIDVL